MPRFVRHERNGPIRVDPATIPPGKSIWVCGCGLSRTFPLCDGTHKTACAAEQPGTIYTYNADGSVADQRPDPGP